MFGFFDKTETCFFKGQSAKRPRQKDTTIVSLPPKSRSYGHGYTRDQYLVLIFTECHNLQTLCFSTVEMQATASEQKHGFEQTVWIPPTSNRHRSRRAQLCLERGGQRGQQRVAFPSRRRTGGTRTFRPRRQLQLIKRVVAHLRLAHLTSLRGHTSSTCTCRRKKSKRFPVVTGTLYL